MSTGTVTNVTEHTAGSELSTAASATDTTLSVINVNEFDQDGGYLLIGDEQFAYTYTLPVDADGVDIAPEDGSGDLDLVGSLANAYSAGEPVYQVNSDGTQFVERSAYVLEPDGEEELKLRVPHALFALLPLGARDEETAEQVAFAQDGTDLVITDILGRVVHTFELPQGGSGAAIDRGLIRWRDLGTDVNVATVQGIEATPDTDWLVLAARQRDSTRDAVNHLEVLDSAGNIKAYVQTRYASDDTSRIDIGAGGTGKTLLYSTGLSDFLFDNAWTDWTPTLTGWSANPASGVYRYKQVGKMVRIAIRQPTDGTSNATTKSISLPPGLTAATITGMVWDGPCGAVDNGAALTTSARATITSGSSTINFSKDWSALTGGWTAANAHRIATCHLVYESAA